MIQKISVFIFMFLSLSSFAQNEVELLEERTDKGIVLTAVNHSQNQSVEIILTITSSGFGLKKEETFTEVITANSQKEMVTLVPAPGRKCTYSANLSYTTTNKTQKSSTAIGSGPAPKRQAQKPVAAPTAKPKAKPVADANPLSGKKGIVVYSKQGCGRCDFVTKYLSENNIPFQDLNITTDKAADQQMAKVLFANGFKGGSFTTPVITVDEEVHYNIKDLRGFLEKLNE